jgi:hypothetical protein
MGGYDLNAPDGVGISGVIRSSWQLTDYSGRTRAAANNRTATPAASA